MTETEPTPAPAPEQPAPPAPAEERVSFTADEWEAELRQAEERGYLRGRNEQIASLMESPRILENPTEPAAEAPDSDETFLRYVRPSVWD